MEIIVVSPFLVKTKIVIYCKSLVYIYNIYERIIGHLEFALNTPEKKNWGRKIMVIDKTNKAKC